MKVGLNLSFAVKRWLEPEYLAAMIKNDFKTEYIQFTWDLLNPWWPAGERDALARKWSRAFKKEGLIVGGTFGGLASYTYPQLLSPTVEQRRISMDFFKRAIDMTAAMDVTSIGTPLGGMDHKDAHNANRRAEIYSLVLDLLRELAAYAKTMGLEKIIIEPTPLATEFPSDPKETLKLMRDLEGTTDLPVLILLDWGHALFKPLLKEEADMSIWFETCRPYIDALHLQQTDGMLDRHWDFTKQGLLTTDLIRKITEEHNAAHLVQYVEVVYAFEETDEDVYENMRRTMLLLQDALGGGGC